MVALTLLTTLLAATSLVASAPTAEPQKFRIRALDPDSANHFTNYYLQAYHTGAGLADPVFVPSAINGTTAFLNGTHLQFDVGQGDQYPFALSASLADTNYARWEPTSIGISYGYGKFVNNGSQGIQIDDEEFGGWVLCRWFHSVDLPGEESAPQLFVAIQGFQGNPGKGGPPNLPSSCANVLLFPEFL